MQAKYTVQIDRHFMGKDQIGYAVSFYNEGQYLYSTGYLFDEVPAMLQDCLNHCNQ